MQIWSPLCSSLPNQLAPVSKQAADCCTLRGPANGGDGFCFRNFLQLCDISREIIEGMRVVCSFSNGPNQGATVAVSAWWKMCPFPRKGLLQHFAYSHTCFLRKSECSHSPGVLSISLQIFRLSRLIALKALVLASLKSRTCVMGEFGKVLL